MIWQGILSKILVIGNAIIDQIMQISQFPKQDQEMRATGQYTSIGGNACNTAQILAQLGHQVQLVSSLGDDREALDLTSALTKKNVGTQLCVTNKGYKTPFSSIWLNQQNGSRTIIHYRDLPELQIEDLQSIDVTEYDWIHFEGRNTDTLKIYLESISNNSARTQIILSLEIEKSRPHIEDLLPYIDIAIVSSHYLNEKAWGAEHAIQQFQRNNPSLKIACTLGDSGVLGSDSAGSKYTFPAIAMSEVIDTIGAGDCFIAGLISAVAQNHSFNSALQFANQLAAYKIKQRGMSIEGYSN